ncbi:hypothetical protein BV898_10025 [Hypsibius exemplaris]|uniref:Uncharacterized protein n=1 Tax=Hypsibius exemplaris TaxID=2072580 RepID=A0A1W0WKM9_HYPEX|nr:hypothetical protein BV898_10025 [Hypsibius exemplaris]
MTKPCSGTFVFFAAVLHFISVSNAQNTSTVPVVLVRSADNTTPVPQFDGTTTPAIPRSTVRTIKFRGAQSRLLDEDEADKENFAPAAPKRFDPTKLSQLISKINRQEPLAISRIPEAPTATTSDFFFLETTTAPPSPTSIFPVIIPTFTTSGPETDNDIPNETTSSTTTAIPATTTTTTPSTTTSTFATTAASTTEFVSTTPSISSPVTERLTTTTSTTSAAPFTTVTNFDIQAVSETTTGVSSTTAASPLLATTDVTTVPTSTLSSSTMSAIVPNITAVAPPTPPVTTFIPIDIKLGAHCTSNAFCDALVPNSYCEKRAFQSGTCQCRPSLHGDPADAEYPCGRRSVCAGNPCRGDQDASFCTPIVTSPPKRFRDYTQPEGRSARMLSLDIIYQAVFGDFDCRCVEGAVGRNHSSVTPGVCCTPDRIACPDMSGCYSLSEICDGKKQCLDCSDETYKSCLLSKQCDPNEPLFASPIATLPRSGIQKNRAMISRQTGAGYTDILGQILPYRSSMWGVTYGRRK